MIRAKKGPSECPAKAARSRGAVRTAAPRVQADRGSRAIGGTAHAQEEAPRMSPRRGPSNGSTAKLAHSRLTNHFLFEDRCALPNQMSFVLTFPWRGFVLAMRGRDRAYQSEIAALVPSVTTKNFPHHVLPL